MVVALVAFLTEPTQAAVANDRSLCDFPPPMTGNELLRKLSLLARRKGMVFEFNARTGKGGHARIRFGSRRTLLRSARQKEIPSGSLRGMLSDLGIDPREL
jgi:hypothetical protein